MNKFLVLYSDTFLWYSNEEGVLYNCKSAQLQHFELTSTLLRYCKLINDFNNMYAISILPDDEKDPVFCEWLNKIVELEFGMIKEQYPNQKKPFNFPPILNLRCEIEEKCMNDSLYRASSIANNFHEITFLLGGEILPDNEIGYFKQTYYPISTHICLEANDIFSLLNSSNINYLQQINLICNNLYGYHNIITLVEKLCTYNKPLVLFFKGRKSKLLENLVDCLKSNLCSLKMYFTDIESFQSINTLFNNKNIDYQWIFIIKDENDYKIAEDVIGQYNIINYKLVPVLQNDLNEMTFFRNNVFITFFELSNTKLSKQNIFCNQVINSNYWGKLFVTPERKVYANLNSKALGTINDDLMCLIRTEMKDDMSDWKCTREKVVPCNDCIYRFLCPPPSNYEFILNRFNLCTIKE